jgi:hypothetical protein
MLTDNRNFREAGHIAEELLDNQAYELERRCASVERSVKGGAFLLDKALKLYKVDMDNYIDYIAKTHADNMSAELTEATEKALMIHKIKVMIKLFTRMFENVDPHEIVILIDNLDTFSNKVERGEVVYK